MPFNWTRQKVQFNGLPFKMAISSGVGLHCPLTTLARKTNIHSIRTSFTIHENKQSQKNNETRRLIISLLWFNWPFYAYKRTHFRHWRHTRIPNLLPTTLKIHQRQDFALNWPRKKNLHIRERVKKKIGRKKFANLFLQFSSEKSTNSVHCNQDEQQMKSFRRNKAVKTIESTELLIGQTVIMIGFDKL